MPRFTIRDLLWLTVVMAMAVTIWIHTARYKSLTAEHKALERRFAGLIEIVTSTGLIEIIKTAPGEYTVHTGPVAKDLWNKSGQRQPATPNHQ